MNCVEQSIPGWLLVLGFSGQVAFSLRFIVQWVRSEIKKESHIPIAFWYFSIVGGGLLLLYAFFRKDPVEAEEEEGAGDKKANGVPDSAGLKE